MSFVEAEKSIKGVSAYQPTLLGEEKRTRVASFCMIAEPS